MGQESVQAGDGVKTGSLASGLQARVIFDLLDCLAHGRLDHAQHTGTIRRRWNSSGWV